MNSCILLAEITQEPQLRYTPDQTAIAEMQVQFAGLRPEDPPATVKAVGWGNMAQEVQANYHQGDRVILEGRLSMVTFDRPEGFKEKRAELTIQKIYALNDDSLTAAAAPAVGMPSATVAAPSAPPTAAKRTVKAPPAPAPLDQPELDDIPF